MLSHSIRSFQGAMGRKDRSDATAWRPFWRNHDDVSVQKISNSQSPWLLYMCNFELSLVLRNCLKLPRNQRYDEKVSDDVRWPYQSVLVDFHEPSWLLPRFASNHQEWMDLQYENEIIWERKLPLSNGYQQFRDVCDLKRHGWSRPQTRQRSRVRYRSALQTQCGQLELLHP